MHPAIARAVSGSHGRLVLVARSGCEGCAARPGAGVCATAAEAFLLSARARMATILCLAVPGGRPFKLHDSAVGCAAPKRDLHHTRESNHLWMAFCSGIPLR